MSSSHAEDNPFIAPAVLFPISSAIFAKSSETPVIDLLRVSISSAPFTKLANAFTLLLSVISSIFANPIPSSFTFFNPFIKSSKLLIFPPSVLLNFPPPSARFKSIFLVAVAAEDASTPASANLPNNANTSSISNPKVFATDPAIGIAVCK